MMTNQVLNYRAIAERAKSLWTRQDGPWACDAEGQPIKKPNGFTDIHSPRAVSFNRAGAILRALEEVVGVGQSINRQYVSVDRLLSPDGTVRDAVERMVRRRR